MTCTLFSYYCITVFIGVLLVIGNFTHKILFYTSHVSYWLKVLLIYYSNMITEASSQWLYGQRFVIVPM